MKLKANVIKTLGILVAALAFTMAQHSFMFMGQPRAPKHLKRD